MFNNFGCRLVRPATGALLALAICASACGGGSDIDVVAAQEVWLVDEGSLAGTKYCETVAAIPMLWVDEPGRTSAFVDSWSAVDDVPEVVNSDVAAALEYGQLALDGAAPRFGSALASRLERMLDAGVQGCPDLPTRIGHAGDWAVGLGWNDVTTNFRCDQSLEALETGWEQYREIRPNELRHGEQIEVATFVEWLRWIEDHEEKVDWILGPDLHGLRFEKGAVEIHALPPCMYWPEVAGSK